MAILDDLHHRGLISEVTHRDDLAKLLDTQIVPVYAGYDPTSTSLHIGNLVPTILLKRFQLAGHRPIVLVGGATGMIGDPSGRSDERNLLDEQTLATNVAAIRTQLSRLLDFDDPVAGAAMTNNIDWTRGVDCLEFLRCTGKHLTINYMMAKESVKNRLEGDGISYTEFSYMLLQAFDFVSLASSHGCRLQVGGSDQYGNITAGCELSHKLRGPQLFGLVAPLLLDSSGQKMGKTSTGERISLDPALTSPSAFYHYWFDRRDEEAARFIKIFSLRPLDELQEMLRAHDTDRTKRLAQRELARAMTSWVHGEAAIAEIEASRATAIHPPAPPAPAPHPPAPAPAPAPAPVPARVPAIDSAGPATAGSPPRDAPNEPPAESPRNHDLGSSAGPLLEDLARRGLVEAIADPRALGQLLASQVVPVYAGYDPTAASLHIGHLVPTILLKRLQLAGHRPIVLLGGATGLIGDPSGRSEERALLDEPSVAANLGRIRAQLTRLLDFDDPVIGTVMTDNAEWIRGVSFLELLRTAGKHLTLNYMRTAESVKGRLRPGESPPRAAGETTADVDGISHAEFSYMLLQAFDFVALSRSHGCRLQVGGSDQYSNITAGCELSRKLRGPQLFGLVAPLLLDSSGHKIGKASTGERISLDPTITSPYDFYQYWFNRSDEDTERLVKMFSLRSLDELAEILREHDRDRAKRHAQRELARALTGWVHGRTAILGIEAANRVMFSGTSIKELTDVELAALSQTLPRVDLRRDELVAGISLLDLLVTATNDSKSAARRLITQGGAYVNDIAIKDPEHKLGLADLATDTMLVVRSGKKRYHLVRIT